MAGDWIKVESATPNKPEVLRVARILHINKDEAFGKLMRFWMWCDENSVDGHVDGIVSTDVDAVVGCDGFSEALKVVGWLEFDDDKEIITISNFERHNGETAKKRGLKTKRQKRYRENIGANVDGIVSTPASTREEKRREDNNNKTPAKKFTDEDLLTADFVFKKIQQLNPGHEEPNFESWANDIRLMRERDGRSHEDIKSMFEWANNDDFWKTNILSPSKLRKQWDKLVIKKNSEANNANFSSGHKSNSATGADRVMQSIAKQLG